MKNIITVVLLLVLLVSGCISQYSGKAPKAIFDMSHGEIFPVDEMTQASYTEMYYFFYEMGFDVSINKKPITRDILDDIDVLIIAGPITEFKKDEIISINKFVSNGGCLLLLTHIWSPLNDLVQEFNITISNHITADEENQISTSPQDFFIMELDEHPVTEGVSNIAVFGTWSVISGEPSRTIAWTSDSAYPDINKNRKFDPEIEKKQKLGIVSVTEYDKGKVVVIADDAILVNMFINKGDNRLFAKNIIEWFKQNN